VSPILIRPVREQLEHDRLIRFLQAKYQKKFEVVANVGESQAGPVKLSRPAPFFPDLVLLTAGKIAGLIEVETSESTNNLEALAQWQHFARARVPFYLYVPVPNFDAAQRFCTAYQIGVTEIWTYRSLYDGFDLVRMVHNPSAVANTPKATSVVGKLLPPVTPVHVEPEKEAKILELTNLVEMANRSFRAAASKASTAAAARAAARAAAKAAAAKPAAPATPAPAPAVPANGKPGKGAKPAPPEPAPKAGAAKAAVKPAAPAPAARTAKPEKASKPEKVAKPEKAAKPEKVTPAPAPKAAKKAAAPKAANKSVRPANGKPAKAPQKAKKTPVPAKAKKAARKR
jgi:hypothetical protein